MRVFITGVAGFLGSHLADAFLERGDLVGGCDNFIGGDVDNIPEGVDFYEGDCNDLPRMRNALRAVDVVYHCAATAHEGLSVFAPYENAKNGYAASAAVFSAACAERVRRVVFTSSMARYGKGSVPPPFTEDMAPLPEDPYGIGKYASEQMLQNLAETHGIEWSVAVPHNIYGPRQSYVDPFRNVISIFANLMLQKRQPVIYGDGKQQRCFSFYTDCVGPLVDMAVGDAANGQVINIGPDEGVVTILEVAAMVAKSIGFPLDPIFKPARPREVMFAHCSAHKARGLLGYKPEVSLQDGIDETVAHIEDLGTRPFSYHNLGLEIESERLPTTWSRKLF